jgi:hypothetical protein
MVNLRPSLNSKEMRKMAKIGYIKGVDKINFTPYINKTRFKYAILEKVNKIEFKKLEDDDINALDCWEKGRLFGYDTELKWQKRYGKFHLVITTEESNLPEGFTPYSDDLKPLPERSIYLWGTKDRLKNSETGKDVVHWYETKIPKLFEYPIDTCISKCNRVKLKIQEYELLQKDEQISSIIHRFVGIEEE